MLYPTDKKHCEMSITATIRSEKQKSKQTKLIYVNVW